MLHCIRLGFPANRKVFLFYPNLQGPPASSTSRKKTRRTVLLVPSTTNPDRAVFQRKNGTRSTTTTCTTGRCCFAIGVPVRQCSTHVPVEYDQLLAAIDNINPIAVSQARKKRSAIILSLSTTTQEVVCSVIIV